MVAVAMIGAIIGSIMIYPTYVWAEKQAKSIDDLAADTIFEPTIIKSRNGKILYRAQAEYRKPVKYNEIPEHVIYATLAAEDERFFEHQGIDPRSLIRALFENVSEQRMSQGASTITMQLAKKVYTSSEKDFNRKIKDMTLAYHIERLKTKEQILKMYLNKVYYGAGAHGISAAAAVYFGKRLDQLTIAEAALLARLVQLPSVYNPFRKPELAVEKRNVVLAKMREMNWITDSEYQTAKNEPLKLQRGALASGAKVFDAGWFTHWVIDSIEKEYPDFDLNAGGYQIETTIDTELQALAEDEVAKVVRRNRRAGVTTGAFLLMNSNGEVLAMVGGANYQKNQYNVISQGKRQPGSAMKPFIFAAGLASGALSRYESISNEPHFIENPNGPGKIRWPKGGGKGGSVSIRTTLAASINVPSVRAIEKVGPRTAVRYCKNAFGFTSELDPVPALVLGSSAVSPLELAQAYSVFMLYGDRAKPFGIKRIICPDGRIIDNFGPQISRNVLDSGVCNFIDGCLSAVVHGGTGKEASGIPNARGKTGTTSDHRDAWFCGYTNNLVGVAWVANEQRIGDRTYYKPMDGVFGGYVSVDIWTGVLRHALKRYDDSQKHTKGFEVPTPYIETESYRDETPAEPGPDTQPGDEEKFPETVPPIEPSENPATEPTPPAAEPKTGETKTNENELPDQSVEVCTETGYRANPYCPSTATQKFSPGKIPRRCPIHGP